MSNFMPVPSENIQKLISFKKLTQDKIEKQNRLITTKEIKIVL